MKAKIDGDFYHMLCGIDQRLSLPKVLIFCSFIMICGLSIFNIVTQKEAQEALISPFTTILSILGVAKMAQSSVDFKTKVQADEIHKTNNMHGNPGHDNKL